MTSREFKSLEIYLKRKLKDRKVTKFKDKPKGTFHRKKEFEQHHSIPLEKYLDWHLENLWSQDSFKLIKPVQATWHHAYHAKENLKQHNHYAEGVKQLEQIRKSHRTNFLMPNL